MNKNQYTEIDGIKCYSYKSTFQYKDYPDSGFDFMNNKSEQSFWVQSRNRLFKKIIYKYMPNSGNVDLLEIGCGTGGFIKHISENNRLNITGSEIYHKGLVYAKNNIPQVNFIQYDILDDVLTSHFDFIIAFDVLEHIEDDTLAISNIFKMLNSGGIFIMTVPQHMFLWSKLDEIVKHKRRYSRTELINKIQINGFNIKYISSFVFFLFPLMYLSRLFDRGSLTANRTEENELENRVIFNPVVNWIFDKIMRFDELLIQKGLSLPFGGTLILIASKS